MIEKTTGWPPKRRAQYAARIRKTKIWKASTGPRTEQGKAISSKNNLSHGANTGTWLLVRNALRAQRILIAQLKQVLKIISIRSIHVEPKCYRMEPDVPPYHIIYAPLHYVPNIRDGFIGTFFGQAAKP